MVREMPHFSHLTLYILSINLAQRSACERSSHWKLTDGKVAAFPSGGIGSDDHLFSLLTNKISLGNGEWSVTGDDTCTKSCNENTDVAQDEIKASEEKKPKEKQKRPKGDEAKKLKVASKAAKHLLDCGDVVLKTGVDHLSGISNRHKHPDFAEPEVALIFGKPGTNLDTSDMEKTLHQAMRDHPTSPHVYNHIGNFWRIRGNTRLAIQCFRKALSLSPNNSDVLLNLGRVLMNLKYDDDALVLTMQSLRMLQPGQNSWLQHFTLGEILKSRSIDEAAVHFRLALELNPGFSAAQAYLDDIEGGNIMFASPLSLSHIVTVLIATVVVLLFCYYLVKWLDSTLSEFRSCEFHYQRHFNRAMAMRSLRGGLNPKLVRARKQQQVG